MPQAMSFEAASEWADSILTQMTLEEKCKYIGGTEIFFTQAIERLGIPKVMFSDATAGVVLHDRFFDHTYQNAIKTSVAFPAPILLASTWNVELALAYAKSIGEQCVANGIGVLLGPGFNLYRMSQCGRNFEYFGEDPFLISSMVENYVTGVQSTGTIATLKHFVANNTDYFRRKSNSLVDERTLHEIYLPGFKAGIEAGAMAVMTAYNLVKGEWAGQSEYVIKHLLRGVLKFKWLVMTDWWSVYDGEKVAHSGQDIEMPASDATACFLEKIKNGQIAESDLDRMVKSILTTFKAMNLFESKAQPQDVSHFPDHEKIALRTAREGTVLLRNQDHLLPLQVKEDNILLLGDYIHKKASGGGSSYVRGYNQITLYEALHKIYGDKLQYEPAPSDETIREAKHLILSIGTADAESWDRPFALPRGEELYVKRILALNPRAVVLINAGSGIRMTDWYEKAGAILFCYYNGQNGNIALAEIISGEISPSGKLPFTIEKEFSDGPGADYIPDGEALYYGENDAWEKARNVYDVEYKEGIFVGYRWYEHKQIEPLYPFGFGLSYSEFSYSDLDVDQSSISSVDLLMGQPISVTFKLSNTGARSAHETVQLYLADKQCSEARPVKELKGFDKVYLNAGESTEMELSLTQQSFEFWSEAKSSWVLEPGEFDILIGASSADIILQKTITVV